MRNKTPTRALELDLNHARGLVPNSFQVSTTITTLNDNLSQAPGTLLRYQPAPDLSSWLGGCIYLRTSNLVFQGLPSYSPSRTLSNVHLANNAMRARDEY